MRLDPRQLSIFLAVTRAGSLSAAARDIGLSQPGISAAIAQLERSVGSRLLDRGRHGAVPTEAGRLLVRKAEAIEELITQARREVELQATGLAGPLIIAGTPGALMSLVPEAIVHLRKKLPGFELRIVEAHDRDLLSLLRDRKADLTVSTVGLEPPPDDVEEIAVTQDALELVLARDNPHRAAVVSLRELGGFPWVLPAEMGAFRRHIDALFISNSVPLPNDVVLCDSLATTKEIIRHTDYVTILPSSVVAPEVESGLLRTIQLREWLVTRAVGVRRLRATKPTAVTAAFLDALSAQAGP